MQSKHWYLRLMSAEDDGSLWVLLLIPLRSKRNNSPSLEGLTTQLLSLRFDQSDRRLTKALEFLMRCDTSLLEKLRVQCHRGRHKQMSAANPKIIDHLDAFFCEYSAPILLSRLRRRQRG